MVVNGDRSPEAVSVTVGSTVMVNIAGTPLQPVVFVGVTVMVAMSGRLPVFMAVNGLILPEPVAGRPMPGVSFTQLKARSFVPVKLIAVVAEPFIRVWLGTGSIVGDAFMVAETATFWFGRPGKLNTTFPDIMPGTLSAAALTYTVVGLSVPWDWLSSTVLP